MKKHGASRPGCVLFVRVLVRWPVPANSLIQCNANRANKKRRSPSKENAFLKRGGYCPQAALNSVHIWAWISSVSALTFWIISVLPSKSSGRVRKDW